MQVVYLIRIHLCTRRFTPLSLSLTSLRRKPTVRFKTLFAFTLIVPYYHKFSFLFSPFPLSPLSESKLAASCESGARFLQGHSRGGPPRHLDAPRTCWDGVTR